MMNFSVCILVHEWHEKLPQILEAYSTCTDEILLGINGDFMPEQYPILSDFPKASFKPLLWQGYGTTRNQLSAQASNDWVLHTDLDELPDTALLESLRHWSSGHATQLYAVQRLNYIGTVPIRHGAWGSGKKWFSRLYNRRLAAWDNAAVHERLILPEGHKILRLPGKLRHFTAPDIATLQHKSRHYAKLFSKRYFEKGQKPPLLKQLFSPAFTFIKQYFFQRGFLDGATGFQIARTNALYSYWKYRKPKDNTSNYSDTN